MNRDKLFSIIRGVISLLFWLAVWEICALAIDVGFIFPRIGETMLALGNLIITKDFWLSILFSFLRIFYGLILGVILGILTAFLSHRFETANAIISPAVTAIKSTPVASAIMLVWFIIGSDTVPIAIALLMVLPIIWQSTIDGLSSVNNDLNEVCKVFRISYFKKMKILIIPALLKFLLPALVIASGFAWKSGIAAEIISYTENSIGRLIIDAKGAFDGAPMFAMTLTVVLLSVLIEKLIKLIVGSIMKNRHTERIAPKK